MRTYFKLMLWLYFLVLLACGVCRVILKLNYIDISTGFYSGGDLFVFVFNACLAAAPILMFASNRLKKADGDYPVYITSGATNVIAFITGVSIVAFAILGSPESTLEQGRSELFYAVGKNISLGLGVLAGLSFIYLGIGGVFGRRKAPLGLIVIIPAIWQVILLISRYNGYTTVTTISDHLLVVLFMMFNSLFLLGQARTVCMHMRKDGRNYAIPSGLSASLCGFLLTIPNFVYMFINSSSSIPTFLIGFAESVCIFIMSVYSLFFVIGMMRSIKKV